MIERIRVAALTTGTVLLVIVGTMVGLVIFGVLMSIVWRVSWWAVQALHLT